MKTIIIKGIEVTIVKNFAYKVLGIRRETIYGKIILCIFCKEEKFVSNSQLNQGASLSHQKCKNTLNGLERRNNTERSKQVIISTVISQYKCHSKQRNYKFELTRDEVALLIFNDCSYCGSLPDQQYYDRTELKYNGMDRVNNRLGYITGNCVTCCGTCNRAKNNMHVTSFEAWLNQVAKFRMNLITNKNRNNEVSEIKI
jgi:hypothetical protein